MSPSTDSGSGKESPTTYAMSSSSNRDSACPSSGSSIRSRAPATAQNGGNGRQQDHPRHRGMDGDTDVDGHQMVQKIEFPKFDGVGDPMPWLNRCERYFCMRGTPENKVQYASFYLLDDAQMWYHRRASILDSFHPAHSDPAWAATHRQHDQRARSSSA
jgi:hypothetical protein